MRFLLFAALVAAGLSSTVEAAERIRLLADPWCPHTCAAGATPGYMIEIAKRAFARQGIEVEYRTVAWARAMGDVRQGKADGAVGALRDEAQDLALHQEPLGHQSNSFAVRADDPWTFSGLDSLNGRTVGSILGYSYSTEIDAWLAGHKKQVQATGGEDALDRNLTKLVSRRLDVVVEDGAVLAWTLAQRKDAKAIRLAGKVTGGDLFIAFTKSGGRGDRLAEILDQGIRDLRASGELWTILASYGLAE